MRSTIATRAGGWRWTLACGLLVSALSIGAVGTVSGSNGEPTAAASKKKKCKKKVVKAGDGATTSAVKKKKRCKKSKKKRAP